MNKTQKAGTQGSKSDTHCLVTMKALKIKTNKS